MTKAEITEIARQAGIEIPGTTLVEVTTQINEWIASEDETEIPAVDLFERIAWEHPYRGEAIQDRCDAGEFDAWAPIWTAA